MSGMNDFTKIWGGWPPPPHHGHPNKEYMAFFYCINCKTAAIDHIMKCVRVRACIDKGIPLNRHSSCFVTWEAPVDSAQVKAEHARQQQSCWEKKTPTQKHFNTVKVSDIWKAKNSQTLKHTLRFDISHFDILHQSSSDFQTDQLSRVQSMSRWSIHCVV